MINREGRVLLDFFSGGLWYMWREGGGEVFVFEMEKY